MKVTLIEYTGSGWQDPAARAADILIFTKNTRLTMSPALLDDIALWPWRKKLEELKYMARTIPSSWEFVDYTFMIEGVTRAFTHQLVRTRTASFAQQTMRVLNVSDGPGWGYLAGPTIDQTQVGTPIGELTREEIYQGAMNCIDGTYKLLIQNGAAIEDARGILPTNILTNIVMKCNMRAFVEMVRKRSSSRTQGEYRDVLEGMKAAVKAKHSWIELFLERDFDNAANELNHLLLEVSIPDEKRTHAVKLLDIMREQS